MQDSGFPLESQKVNKYLHLYLSTIWTSNKSGHSFKKSHLYVRSSTEIIQLNHLV